MKRNIKNFIILVCLILFSSTIITLGICIYQDHHITYRDGTDEYTLNLLETSGVRQSLYINGTKKINIATSVGKKDAMEEFNNVTGKICWKISCNDGEMVYGEKELSEYDYNTWTNTVIDVGKIEQNQYVDIELWGEGVNGVENVVFIISKSKQKNNFGRFYIGTEEQEDCLQLSYFSFSGFNVYAKLWIKLTIILLVFLITATVILKIFRNEPIVLIFIIRWLIEFLYNQPYKNFNNTMGYTLWMYSFQKLGLASRILPGSILKLLKNEISKENMLNAGLVCQIMALIVVVVFFYLLLKKSNEPIKGYLKILMILYGFSPFFISFYDCPTLFLHYDELLIVFFIISIYFACTGKRIMYCIPILCIGAMFTHEMFILLCFPWLFSYLIYRFVRLSEKKYLYVATISAVVVSAIFIKIVLLTDRNFDINSILALLQSDVLDEGLISAFYVSTYYTMSSVDKLILDHYDAFRFDAVTQLIVGIIVCSPFLMILARFYYKLGKSKKILNKLATSLFFLSPLGIVVACYKACDFSRWAIMSIICGVFTAIIMIFSGDEKELKACEYGISPAKNMLGEHWLYILSLYLLLNGLGGTVNMTQLSKYISGIIETISM